MTDNLSIELLECVAIFLFGVIIGLWVGLPDKSDTNTSCYEINNKIYCEEVSE